MADNEMAIFNGYPVKDAAARLRLDNIEKNSGNYSQAFLRPCEIHREATATGIVEKLIVSAGSVPEAAGTSEETGVNLDTVAWGGLTYRQIFMENNLLGKIDFDDTLTPGAWENVLGNGTIERTEEVSVSGSSLHMVSSGAVGGGLSGMTCIKTTGTMATYAENTYYSAHMSNVVTFEADAGLVGMVAFAYRYGFARVTDGFRRVSYQRTISYDDAGEDGTIYQYNRIGFCSASTSTGEHNAEFYIDEPVLVRTSALWETPPTKTLMDALYDNYIAIRSGGTINPIQHEEEIFYIRHEVTNAVDDAEALEKFVSAMNERAAFLGMSNTVFYNPAGIAPDVSCKSTMRDIMRLGIAACGYRDILRSWGKHVLNIQTSGSNPRTIECKNIIDFENYSKGVWNGESFKFFGGKGGSWSTQGDDPFSYVMLALAAGTDGQLIIAAVAGTPDVSLYNATIETVYRANQALKGEDVSAVVPTTENVVCAMACKLPEYDPAIYDAADLEVLYEYNADTVGNLASVTKVMCAMVAIDHTPNLDTEIVTIKESDEVGYSGINLYRGEKMTMREAIFNMLHRSSNMTAYAIGRTVGEKIV